MGHQRLGRLPATRNWRAVIALITEGSDAANIAAATAEAAEGSLRAAAKDPTLRDVFFLLTQIPLAARSSDFAQALYDLDIVTVSQPNLIEIVTALTETLDRKMATQEATNDFSEMASKAAIESLFDVASREGLGLLGASHGPDEARAVLHQLAIPRQFGVLARDFVSRLIRSCISYYLSRELPNHVGGNSRFRSIKEHDQFVTAVDLHCRETSRIVEQFASEWFSKANFEGGITREKAGGFIHVAFQKVVKELRARHVTHA